MVTDVATAFRSAWHLMLGRCACGQGAGAGAEPDTGAGGADGEEHSGARRVPEGSSALLHWRQEPRCAFRSLVFVAVITALSPHSLLYIRCTGCTSMSKARCVLTVLCTAGGG